MASLRRFNFHTRRADRAGVTLVELLVAICIVAVLVGLTFLGFSLAQRTNDKMEAQLALVDARYRKAKQPPNRPASIEQKVPNQYLVIFQPSVTNPGAEAKRLSQVLPATVLHVYNSALKGCTLNVEPAGLAALQLDAAVARVEQDQYVHKCVATTPSGINRIRYSVAPQTPPFRLSMPGPLVFFNANSQPQGPRNIPKVPIAAGATACKVVAVIDSGIDSKHPELNVIQSKGFGLADGEDQDGHGTHVAGTIGARGINIVGVLPGVPLWSLRVLDAMGVGTLGRILAALDYVHVNARQISVVNMSLGGGYSQIVNDAVDRCTAAGVVMCAAAGNFGVDASLLSPASAPTAICVGALCDTDGLPGGTGAPGSFGDPDDTMTGFSCFGRLVTVVAPGEDIFSTWLTTMGSYNTISGTSMSCPHVAGMSALILTMSGQTAAGTGSGPRNVPASFVKGMIVNNPADVRAWLLQNSVETISGVAVGDTRTYPVITGRP